MFTHLAVPRKLRWAENQKTRALTLPLLVALGDLGALESRD